jgi:hypothetical protein
LRSKYIPISQKKLEEDNKALCDLLLDKQKEIEYLEDKIITLEGGAYQTDASKYSTGPTIRETPTRFVQHTESSYAGIDWAAGYTVPQSATYQISYGGASAPATTAPAGRVFRDEIPF